MARIFLILVVIALHIYTLIDVIRSSVMPARRISKPVWIILVLVPILGPLVWLGLKYQHVFTKDSFQRPGTSAFGPQIKKSREAAAPVAPDDDPEFLARLDAQNRRKAWEERQRKEKEAKGEPETPRKPEDGEEHGGLYGHK
ncbi:PLD nuclease N-terminal domain-containing protein [Arcanobacterium wilhelmae]|uniref:PLD nuclease N-terminal domain-containing protein n=1 Tax=Arcanobacterium wilhelmae TaxID=1803177 RepID=UPI002414F550|nr:PLD nuclease N-terminal domain-containing protein [Arcanobacterium wilhelmae]WFN89986.1 PLD nuclease N-terminal domain-containing protein [Arcanobacterium wilhelmae]